MFDAVKLSTGTRWLVNGKKSGSCHKDFANAFVCAGRQTSESRECMNSERFSIRHTRILRHLNIAEAHQHNYLDLPYFTWWGLQCEQQELWRSNKMPTTEDYGTRSMISDDLSTPLRRAESSMASIEGWLKLTINTRLRSAVDWSAASSSRRRLDVGFPRANHTKRSSRRT